jgi:two-component system, NtrC family, sensor histidine kinase KinB
VIANFLQNAFKYAPEPSPILVQLDVQPTFVRVSVIDVGPGIPPEEQPHIFDKYRRSSSTHAHDSSGLGLYVSKRIVEAHGGRIGVESVEGAGAHFYFELPRTH